MRSPPAARLALAALLAAHGVAGAQQPLRAVDPGAVATVGVVISARAAGARYTIEPAPHVRLYGPAVGRIEAAGGDSLVLPLTFATSRDHPAGPLTAARVRLTRADGVQQALDVRVVVRAARRLVLSADSAAVVVTPGGRALVRYRIANRGNAVDTVRVEVHPGSEWHARPEATAHVLARGEEASGVIEVVASPDAQAGTARLVQLLAVGLGESRRAGVSVGVAEAAGWLPGLTHIPATVFVGATSLGLDRDAASATAVAVQAGGTILDRTQLTFAYRRRPVGAQPALFRTTAAGPRLLLTLRNAQWNAGAGEISASGGQLSRTYLHGRGVHLQHTGPRLSGALYLAQPIAFGGEAGPGHLVQARAGVGTRIGSMGVLVTDVVRRIGTVGEPNRLQGAGLHVDLRPWESHRFVGEVGLLHLVAASGEAAAGPAFDGSYTFLGERATASARVRTAPASLSGLGGLRRELLTGGSVRLAGPVRALGSAFTGSASDLASDTHSSNEGVTLGVRLARNAARIDLTANYRRSVSSRIIIPSRERRSLALGIALPVGPVAVEGTTDIGTTRTAGVRGLSAHARGGIFWHAPAGWAALGTNYYWEDGLPALWNIDAASSLRWRSTALEAGAATQISQLTGLGEVTLWSNISLALARDFSVMVGVEHQPWRLDRRWSASLGIRKRIPLPVPVPRRPPARGTVFEDLNLNGRHDAGEPGLRDVGIRFGALHARTDQDGRFAFPRTTSSGSALQLDAASLPTGMLVPPDAHLRPRGAVRIPVVRTASLHLRLFSDENRDGLWDRGELAATGVWVIVTGAGGRIRRIEADEKGIVQVGALLPGTYSITAHAPPVEGRPRPGRTLRITLEPGQAAELDVPAPHVRRRDVRYRQTALSGG